MNKLGYEPEASASIIKLDRTGAILSAIILKMKDGTALIGAPFDLKVSNQQCVKPLFEG